MELKLIHNGSFYKGVTKERLGPYYPHKPYNVGSVHHAVVDTNLSESVCSRYSRLPNYRRGVAVGSSSGRGCRP